MDNEKCQCGIPVNVEHFTCSACGCMIGERHIHGTVDSYHGKEVCPWCAYNWAFREDMVGKEISFREYTGGN